jgi:TolA-binding protein
MAENIDSTTGASPASRELTETPWLTPQRTRMLAIAGAVVLVVALAIWFVTTAGKRKELFAARALETARSTAESGDVATAVQQFEQVAQSYGGTGAGYEASLGVVQARLVAGQSELAIATVEEFLKSDPPAAYAAPANTLLGTALENTGRYAEAAVTYRKASDLATVDYLKAASLLDAGRAARLGGKAAEAQAIYEEIIAKFGETAARTEAEVRLAEMVIKPV